MVIPVKQFCLPPHYTPERCAARFEAIKSRCVITDDGCWSLKGSPNDSGYVQVSIGDKRWMAHRLMYALRFGSLPEKLYVCHKCDNRRCCNPEHMFLGDHLANQQDKHAKGRCPQKAKQTCPKGHPYSGDNLYVTKRGHRMCNICQRAKMRIRAGWPEDIAYSMGVVPHGFTPVGAKWHTKSNAQTEPESAT